MRTLLVVTVVLVALLVAGVRAGVPVPWGPQCRIADPAGATLAQGSPVEVAALVAEPSKEVRRALSAGPALTCRISAEPLSADPKEPPLGLTPRAQALRAEVRATFDDVPDGGFGPEDQLPGRRPGSAHNAGRAIDYFFRPHTDPAQARAGWRMANWMVANADRLGIRTVIYRDRIWTARRSAQGWREYRFAGRDPGNPINRHLDHVHVDVA